MLFCHTEKTADGIKKKQGEATGNEKKVEGGKQWKKWDDEEEDDKMGRINGLNTVA